MGIFSFLAPKRNLSGGQVGLAQPAGANARMQRPHAGGSIARATDAQIHLVSDDKEWLKYLSSAIRTYRKPGLTLKEEHEIWLKARSQG